MQCRRPPNFRPCKQKAPAHWTLFNTGRLGFAGLNNGQFGIVEAAGVDYGLVHNPTVEGEEIVTNGWTLQLGIPGCQRSARRRLALAEMGCAANRASRLLMELQ